MWVSTFAALYEKKPHILAKACSSTVLDLLLDRSKKKIPSKRIPTMLALASTARTQAFSTHWSSLALSKGFVFKQTSLTLPPWVFVPIFVFVGFFCCFVFRFFFVVVVL